jgi:hypothetical protein
MWVPLLVLNLILKVETFGFSRTALIDQRQSIGERSHFD